MIRKRLWALCGLSGAALGVLLAVASFGPDGRSRRPPGAPVQADVLQRQPRTARSDGPGRNPLWGVNSRNPEEVERVRRLFISAGGELPQAYNLEPRDAAWAAPMESSMGRRFSTTAQVVPDIGVADIECRTSTCRIVFEYRGSEPLPDDERARGRRVNALVGRLVGETGALASTWTSLPPSAGDAGLRATYVLKFREDAHTPGQYQEWVDDQQQKYLRQVAERKARAAAAATVVPQDP